MTIDSAAGGHDAGGGALPADPRHDHEAVAAVFKALSEPARLQIVHALADGERRVVDLVTEVGLAQSTTSAHLGVLREAGLVAPRVEGRSTYYRLLTTSLDQLLQRAEELLDEGLHAVVHHHEDPFAEEGEDPAGAPGPGSLRSAD